MAVRNCKKMSYDNFILPHSMEFIKIVANLEQCIC